MTALPRSPSRDNAGHSCERVVAGDAALPDHIERCACPQHDGVCRECNFKITIGPSGTEYGHARATNLGSQEPGRSDCPHRPATVDPNGPRTHQEGEI